MGNALARTFGWDFFDADDFHSPENIAKMTNGIPPTDSDRAPWPAALHNLLSSTLKLDRYPMLARSALKVEYRAQLLDDLEGIEVIYLRGSYELIRLPMSAQAGHYMLPEMLQSQFTALEEPDNVFVLDVSMAIEGMIDKIVTNCFSS